MTEEKKKSQNYLCWICGSEKIVLIKKSNIQAELTSKSFAITDYNYGTTGNIYKCSRCGFLECPELNDILKHYENLEDLSYEDSRKERLIQMRNIVKTIKQFKSSGTLLDVGAGSGILIEEALKAGFEACGIEPSKWLYLKAKESNLPVFLGTFPNKNINGRFDVVTLIDIIEHIPTPLDLIKNISNILKRDGIIVVITPDVGSLAAKLLSWKWWHYRIAHVGYFNMNTIDLAFRRSDLKKVFFKRPSWFFSLDYLLKRINSYLPHFLHLPELSFLKKITIPLNLRDSMLVIYKLNK